MLSWCLMRFNEHAPPRNIINFSFMMKKKEIWVNWHFGQYQKVVSFVIGMGKKSWFNFGFLSLKKYQGHHSILNQFHSIHKFQIKCHKHQKICGKIVYFSLTRKLFLSANGRSLIFCFASEWIFSYFRQSMHS